MGMGNGNGGVRRRAGGMIEDIEGWEWMGGVEGFDWIWMHDCSVWAASFFMMGIGGFFEICFGGGL